VSGDVMVNDTEAVHGLLAAARERILVADSSKIGAEALYRYCKLSDCDVMITDSGASKADLAQLREHAKVVVAK
jgi:DeoR family transcriptional regulator, fructose operon transcriptional repressor